MLRRHAFNHSSFHQNPRNIQLKLCCTVSRSPFIDRFLLIINPGLHTFFQSLRHVESPFNMSVIQKDEVVKVIVSDSISGGCFPVKSNTHFNFYTMLKEDSLFQKIIRHIMICSDSLPCHIQMTRI